MKFPEFSFDPLPEGFVLAKPIKQENYDESIIEKLEKEGRLIITRKRDGWKLLTAYNSKGKVKIYTDGLRDVTAKLAHAAVELGGLKLRNALLIGEGVAEIGDRDQRTKAGSVLGSGVERSLEVQEEIGLLKMAFFEAIFNNKACLLDLLYRSRLDWLKSEIGSDFNYIFVVEELDCSFEKAKKMVVEKGWEGLVLYDRDLKSSFRLDGKDPQRIKGCYKWKPYYEDDFVVREPVFSPDNPQRVKEVELLQIDPKTGKEFSCGKLGSFTLKTREFLQNCRYPIVMQVKFRMRFGSGKLSEAVFMHIREDKKPSECISPKSFS